VRAPRIRGKREADLLSRPRRVEAVVGNVPAVVSENVEDPMAGVPDRYDGSRFLLALWSAPRSRSTAFERMMMQRGDFTVLHEPFSHVADFGTAEVAGTTVTDERDLIEVLRGLTGRVFFKDTTDFHYPHLLADTAFLRRAVHTFIIREPKEVIASHVALNQQVTRDEIGISRLHEIHRAVVAATGSQPVVVDADDLVDRPEDTVRAYCDRVGMPYLPGALRWEQGTPAQWRRTERWHRGASASCGFTRRPADRDGQTVFEDPRLVAYYDHHLPYYRDLWNRRLRL
jgi:hypothetical protein